jgi:hypothetical protein
MYAILVGMVVSYPVQILVELSVIHAGYVVFLILAAVYQDGTLKIVVPLFLVHHSYLIMLPFLMKWYVISAFSIVS